MRQHSCKTLCPSITDLIGVEIEVNQRSALPQQSCKALCPGIADIIALEIKVHQHWALCSVQALLR